MLEIGGKVLFGVAPLLGTFPFTLPAELAAADEAERLRISASLEAIDNRLLAATGHARRSP